MFRKTIILFSGNIGFSSIQNYSSSDNKKCHEDSFLAISTRNKWCNLFSLENFITCDEKVLLELSFTIFATILQKQT